VRVELFQILELRCNFTVQGCALKKCMEIISTRKGWSLIFYLFIFKTKLSQQLLESAML